jgi:GR25 family glycosyltransferase involved in LPS biosynthesis
MNLDTVFVRYINLDRRIDRNEDTIKKFINILGFNPDNIKRFSAIDGSNIIDELKNKNYIDDELIKILQSANLNIKTGELGCLLSHYFLLKEILNDSSISNNSYVFMFEDDFFINTSYLESTNLTDILNKLNASELDNENLWDMIYFGGRFKQNFFPSDFNIKNFFSHSFDNFYLRIEGNGYDWDRTTHNYLIKKKNISKILNCILNYYSNEVKPTIQIDSLYNSFSSKLNMYDYFPHLFYSPMNYSTDIQHSKICINTKELK